MCEQDFHWYGTFNGEKVFFTSLCIAIHSGGIRGERNIMASGSTEGGISWRLRSVNLSSFRLYCPLFLAFNLISGVGKTQILQVIVTRSAAICITSPNVDIFTAIFQTWFFWNSRTHGKTFPIPQLLSLRHHDSWTYCPR